MAADGTSRLRLVHDELDRSTDELAATLERLPQAWRRLVGPDLDRLVDEARRLSHSVGEAIRASEEKPTPSA